MVVHTMDKILKVEDIKNMSTDMLIEAYANGYRIEELNSPKLLYENTQEEGTITSLQCPAISSCSMTCQSSSVTQGANASFYASWYGGTSPYYIYIFEAGTGTMVLGKTGPIYATSYTVNNVPIKLSVGNHALYVYVQDSCSTKQYCNSGSSPCTLSVVAASTCKTISGVALTCPGSVTQGTTASFKISWSGGQGGYTAAIYEQGNSNPVVQWQSISNGGTIGTTANWSTGSHTLYAVVADVCGTGSVQQYAQSGTCAVNVVAATTCGSMSNCTISCPSTVTKGVSASFKISWTGGQGPFTAALFNGGINPIVNWISITNGGTLRFTFNDAPGTTHPSVSATIADFCGGSTVRQYCKTNLCSVTVAAACTSITSCSVSGSSSITQGTSATYTATWSGGNTPYTVDWYIDNGYYTTSSNVSGTSASIQSPSSWTTGSHNIGANVWYKCSDGTTPGCGIAWYSVNVVAPTTCKTMSGVTLTCPSNVVSGTSASFTISWSGGQGGFTAAIYQLNASSPFINWQPVTNGGSISGTVNFSGGGYTVYAVVADVCGTGSVQQYASSNTCMLNVSSSGQLSVGAVSCAGDGWYLMGETAWFTLSWSGGQAPYDVRFYQVGGTEIFQNKSYNGTSITAYVPLTSGFGSPGDYAISASVTDSYSNQKVDASSSCTIHVTAYRLCAIAAPDIITQGTPATFTVNWIGSAGPYSLTLMEKDNTGSLVPWTGLNVNGTPIQVDTGIYGTWDALSTTLTFTPPSTMSGWHYIYATIADSHSTRQYISTPYAYVYIGTPSVPNIVCSLSADFVSGTNNISFTATWSGGIPPYYLDMYVDETYNNTLSMKGSTTSTSYTVTVPTTNLPGNHTIRATASYKVSDGTFRSASSSTTINLLSGTAVCGTSGATLDIHWDFMPLVFPGGAYSVGRGFPLVLTVASAVKVTWRNISSQYILQIFSDNETSPRWTYGPWNGSGGRLCGAGKQCILAGLWDTRMSTGWHRVYAVLYYVCSDGSWHNIASPSVDVYTLYWSSY